MQGRLSSLSPSRTMLTWPCLAASLMAAGLLWGACRRSTAPDAPNAVTPETLLAPRSVVAALIARGGAQISATTHFQIAPTVPEGLLGEQNITTNTSVSLGRNGQYSLHEENNHDGGRDVFFTGDEIAVKLRYGKLIKRAARAPEPGQVLEQALGGPAAAWDVFRAYAQIQAAGADTLSLTLGSSRSDEGPAGPSSPLIDWRKTAVPRELTGKLRYLPATASAPATLVAAEISGRFTAQTIKNGKAQEVQGLVQITFAARAVGTATPELMPAEAETAWMRQRTILEERALLESASVAKSGLPP